MLKLRSILGLSALVLLVGCADDPEGLGDVKGTGGSGGAADAAPEEPLSCCRIRKICAHCTGCPSGTATIYTSYDDEACKAWLEDPDYANGCLDYRGTEAIADCTN